MIVKETKIINKNLVKFLKSNKIEFNFQIRKHSSLSISLNRKKCLLIKSNKPINGNFTQPVKFESTKSLNWLIRPQREKDESSSTVINFDLDKSILKSTSKGSYYHEKIVLGYSREQMCDLVYDVAKYKEFVPFCVNSEIINDKQKTPPRISLKSLRDQPLTKSIAPNTELPTSVKARLEIGYPPIKESYISHVSIIRPQLVKAISRDTALFEYLINEWKFHPYHLSSVISNTNKNSINSLSVKLDSNTGKDVVADDCCIVEFYVSFKFRSAIYTKFSDLFMDQIYKKMINAFTKRANSLYGKPAIEPKSLT